MKYHDDLLKNKSERNVVKNHLAELFGCRDSSKIQDDKIYETMNKLIDTSRDQKASLFLAQMIASQSVNVASLLVTLHTTVGDDTEKFFDVCM